VHAFVTSSNYAAEIVRGFKRLKLLKNALQRRKIEDAKYFCLCKTFWPVTLWLDTITVLLVT